MRQILLGTSSMRQKLPVVTLVGRQNVPVVTSIGRQQLPGGNSCRVRFFSGRAFKTPSESFLFTKAHRGCREEMPKVKRWPAEVWTRVEEPRHLTLRVAYNSRDPLTLELLMDGQPIPERDRSDDILNVAHSVVQSIAHSVRHIAGGAEINRMEIDVTLLPFQK